MAILTTAHVKGQTKEGYDGVLTGLQELIREAPGFILHTSYAYEEGWVVAEIWETKADADTFFAKYVVPNLPAGIHPKRSYQELHSIVTNS
jgi:heme-degrading monooxygenase HmoA